jgi:hypothetical protein
LIDQVLLPFPLEILVSAVVLKDGVLDCVEFAEQGARLAPFQQRPHHALVVPPVIV